jgi:DNA replication protein DnaC
MTPLKTSPQRPVTSDEVDQYLRDLKLAFIAEHYGDLATQAAHKQWSHLAYLGHLVEGEALLRRDRATKNRIRLARFPVIKTLDQFRWDWPTQINRAQVQHHFTLPFLKDHMNLMYLGGVGLGKPQPGNYPSRAERIT